jgi:PAS domain S-box-containing protein
MSPKTTRFEHLLEAVPDALVGMDQKGVIRFVNRQTESLFGFDRDQLIGQPIELLAPEPLWQIYAQNRDEYFADPRTRSSGLEVELVGLRSDGTEFPITVSIAHIDTGDVLLVITAIADVTKREVAVKNAELIAAIVKSSDDAISASTLGGIVTSWNPAAERMYGYSGKEMIGRSASRLSTDDRAGQMKAVLARVRDGEAVDHLETRAVRKDGTEFPVSITTSPVRNEEGVVVGACAISRDVSELKHAAEYARSLIEAALDPLVTISPEGKINDVNDATVKITGIPRNKLIGTDFTQYFTDPDKAHEGYEQVFAQGSVTGYPLALRHREGTLTDVLFNASVYRDLNGDVLGVLAVARDVTEQKSAFEASQQVAALVRYSDDAIISRGLDDAITSWNPAAERILGYSSEEILGKSARFLTPQDREDELKAVVAKVKAGEHVEHLETERVRKDGKVVPVSLTVAPIRDQSGAVVGASTIARDMTEQRQALQAAQRIAAIVEYSDDAIIVRTIDGIITSWNPAAERMFGYSGQEIVGKHFDLLIPQDRAGETISILAKISAGQPIHDYETTRLRKDGSAFPVSLTISPIRDEKGTIISASVICRDITSVRHAARYARSLIEASLDPLVTISPEGKIGDVNEATVKITGVPRNKLIGTDFSRYFTDPDEARQGYQQVFAQGSVTDYPLTLRHRDGTRTDVLYNASVYRDEAGSVLGVFAAARDMTHQKEGFEATQRMAAIVEYSDDAIISNTLEGIITSWNPAAERMFGYTSEEIVGRSGTLLSPKDRSDEIREVLAKVSAGRPVDDFETICTRKDGTTFPVKLTLTPIRDTGGTIVGASAIARDVYAIARGSTEQK